MVTIYESIRNLDNHIVVLPKCSRPFRAHRSSGLARGWISHDLRD
jgi:hypothetical protein